MMERIKKIGTLAAECFVLGFAIAAGVGVFTFLFEIIIG